MVLSLGITLVLVGFATNLLFTLVGGVLSIAALVGWVRQLLPGYPAAPSRACPNTARRRCCRLRDALAGSSEGCLAIDSGCRRRCIPFRRGSKGEWSEVS